MITIADVEKLAFDLPETQRAILAAHLLESLPSVLQDDDDGITEALARDAALDQDPASGISLEQLDEQVARHRARCARPSTEGLHRPTTFASDTPHGPAATRS